MNQLIKKHDRAYEETAIRLGLVRKHKQPYVSTNTLNKILARQARSLEIMGKMEAISDDGETLDMLDVLKGSIANPAVRRAELMNRLHGFEQYAQAHNHIAEFYTITCPSKYHPNSSKYIGSTPRETQQGYLSPLWARIRAKLKYDGLQVYGFRIAEPHADSCPHWHILLFMPKGNTAKVRAILKDYALREDGNEKGALKNRFDVEAIDPNKGSAIGYIAKYISKNVDGFNMEGETDDETGKPVNESAKRVRAWASVWGIRQFQQVGGSSITVWRELRRLEGKQTNPIIEQARQAADTGDWKAYLEAQGGTSTLFKDQPIKTARDVKTDTETGEIKLNQYGELVEYIKGVMTTGIITETRLKHWTIQNKVEIPTPESFAPLTPIETAEQGVQRILGNAYFNTKTVAKTATGGGNCTPWSPVNNCRKAQNTEQIGGLE